MTIEPSAPVAAKGSLGVVLIDSSRPCIQCSYDLQGLPVTGKCPECGSDAALSLKGILLQHAAPEYLQKVRSGLSLVLNGILLYIVLTVGLIFAGFIAAGAGAPSSSVQIVGSLVGLVISLMILVGYFRYSEPDPGFVGSETSGSARQVLRIAVVVQLVLSVLQLGLMLVERKLPNSDVMEALTWVLTLLSLGAWVVQFLSVMNYSHWMAKRIPDVYIIKRTRRYRWLVPLIAVVGSVAVMLGPLIALVMYWNLLDRLRKHLKAITATGAPAKLPKMS